MRAKWTVWKLLFIAAACGTATSSSASDPDPMPVQSCSFPADPDPSQITIEKDLTYATIGGTTLKLDIYRQNDASASFPGVILIHGGSWSSGSKDSVAEAAKILVAEGYAAIAVDYRLASPQGNKFPAAVQDVRCATRWLKANASAHGIDENRLGAAGGSAGGHLASMLGAAAQASGLDSADCGLAGESPDVRAVVSISGPEDLTRTENATPEQARIVFNFLGTLPQIDPDFARSASPISYVDGNTPPFLLIHGTDDTLVPIEQSRLMRDRMLEQGREARLVEIPGAGHEAADFVQNRAHPEAYCEAKAFLEERLKAASR